MKSPARALALAAALAAGPGIGPAAAGPPSLAAQEANPPVSGSSDAAHVLVVTGLGGTPEYADAFHAQGLELVDAALAAGVPAERIRWLAEDPDRAPGRIDGRSTREELGAAIDELAAAAAPADRVLIVLGGHGSGSGGASKLNLPGPDITGEDVAELLEDVPAATVAVVNAASASGGFVGPLSGDGRIVITATRSPRETDRAWFGEFFVEALARDGADMDRDGRVSLLEAFTFTRREVARRYERENQLLTEHALLEDDGDGEGSLEPSAGGGGDGALAARFFLGPPRGVAADGAADAGGDADDPRIAALAAEQAELEDAVAAHRARRDEMDADAYEARLEELLLEIARVNRELREAADAAEDMP